ncbi:MAG TPA: ROK family protein [Methylomirabilota bacterium]|nr:ROK family protein [Methylomirabilota bacterium]
MKGPTHAAQSSHCIGIDVGGTKIAAGLVAFPEGRPVTRRMLPTQPARGGRAVLDDVLRLAQEIADGAAAQGQPVKAIGLGVCELVDRDGRITSANCIQWLDQPVCPALSAIAPATIEADVRAAALAEALFGAGKSVRTFIYVTVGTGISCCLMLDGQPHLGAHGATGTMASSPLSVPCGACGQMGQRTLEEIASGPALVARFNSAHGNANSAQEVLAAAAAGNSVAFEIVRTGAEALGSQIGQLVNVLDPEAVIIGGGLGLGAGLYWDHFVASTRRHIWCEAHRDLPILRAAMGADVGWIGAAVKAWQLVQKIA